MELFYGLPVLDKCTVVVFSSPFNVGPQALYIKPEILLRRRYMMRFLLKDAPLLNVSLVRVIIRLPAGEINEFQLMSSPTQLNYNMRTRAGRVLTSCIDFAPLEGSDIQLLSLFPVVCF